MDMSRLIKLHRAGILKRSPLPGAVGRVLGGKRARATSPALFASTPAPAAEANIPKAVMTEQWLRMMASTRPKAPERHKSMRVANALHRV